MSAILAVSELGKSFDGIGPVFRGVGATVRAGDLVAVTGRRGSGKTSVLRCLGGTYRPSSGSVVLTLDGDPLDLATASPRTLAWVRLHHVVAFDGPLVAPPSQMVAAAMARAAQVRRAEAVLALERLGARLLAGVALGRLRTEQRRVVALAAALVSRAPVVLLDEPDSVVEPGVLTGWLDERRAAGAAIIVADRPGSPVQELATAVIHLDEGRQA